MFDLVIKGGTVVTSGSLAVCDIGVRDGAIAQIGGDLDGARVLDARGKYVFPGGVDIHVHLTSPVDPAPGVEVRPDDFYTGTLWNAIWIRLAGSPPWITSFIRS